MDKDCKCKRRLPNCQDVTALLEELISICESKFIQPLRECEAPRPPPKCQHQRPERPATTACARGPNKVDDEDLGFCQGTESDEFFLSSDPRKVKSVELLGSRMNKTGFFDKRNGLQDDNERPNME